MAVNRRSTLTYVCVKARGRREVNVASKRHEGQSRNRKEQSCHAQKEGSAPRPINNTGPRKEAGSATRVASFFYSFSLPCHPFSDQKVALSNFK